MDYIAKIINAEQTVWTIPELKILLWIENKYTISKILQVMKKKWLLSCPYRWVRCRKNWNYIEFWAKIKSKSYISLQTVLQKNGIIFQDRSDTVTLLSDNFLTKKIGNLNIEIHKIKSTILSNPIGIINNWTYQIASPERAVCDMLYLDRNFYFDNPNNLKISKLEDLSNIYNLSTKKSIFSLIHHIQNDR